MSAPDSTQISLGEAAYRLLHEEIVSCRLPPGERLTERGLAARTGYGVSPIRAALARLDHDGLIVTLPRKGYQVTPLTVRSIDDLFVVWQILGPETVRIGVRSASPNLRREAIAAFDAVDDVYRRRSELSNYPFQAVERVATAFDVLARATENQYLITAYRRLSGDLARVWALMIEADEREERNDDPAHAGVPASRWGEILDQHDGDAAAELAREYIARSHDRIRAVLSHWPSVVSAEVLPLQR